MFITRSTPGIKALLPLFVFIFTFLGVGIVLDDFYALPSPIAVILGIATALLLFEGTTNKKIETLLEGCGDSKILTMCLIYLLAGAFATVSAAMGGVESVVNLGMDLIAIEYLPVGVFLIAAFLSTSTGTSVGSIVALGPIILALAEQSGLSSALMAATLLGGAMFGDNLSIISDTTIAATQSLGVEIKDKFKINLFIALPAAVATLLILYFTGLGNEAAQTITSQGNYSLLKIFPYLLVIGLAVLGVNVFVVLFLGILAAGSVGLYNENFDLLLLSKEVYKGFLSMTDIFFLSLLTGGLAAMVTKAGGIDLILNNINKKISSRKSAQLGIGSLVGLTNVAIANNTVSIIVTGPVAKRLSEDFGLDKRKAAALLDIFACIIQGLLPYGAQILLILSFSKGNFNYFDLLSNAWYLLLLLVFSNLAIFWSVWDKKFLKLKV